MEVIRLYNQVFLLQREAAADIKINDYNLKKGDQVNLLFAFYMRDPNIYPEPDKFSPERWQAGQHPFSSGSRTCPARNFALMLAKAIFYTCWNNHDYEPIDPPQLDFSQMPQIINPYDIRF